MIRVAFDLSVTRLARAGTSRYATDLADALDARDDVTLLRLGGGDLVPRSRSVARYREVARQDLAWSPRLALRAASGERAAVYHTPVPRGPLAPGTLPIVVTVHDLVPFTHPETMSAWNRHYTRVTFARIVRAAARVVTVSQFTATELVRHLPDIASRVRVAHSGVRPYWFEQRETRARRTEEIPERYVLFAGTPEPRKNLARLLEAMTHVRRAEPDVRLVVAGGAGWGSAPVDASVVAVGAADDAVLRDLYRNALVTVLPSLHEGFGLPTLEAMAAGSPVVASRAGALPEVCGDAALYCDALDARDIARAIVAAIRGDGPSCDVRRAHAATFTWDRAAAAVAAVYCEIA